jgi:hypothetical protein
MIKQEIKLELKKDLSRSKIYFKITDYPKLELFKIKQSKTKHSYYSKEATEERKNIRGLISKSKEYFHIF